MKTAFEYNEDDLRGAHSYPVSASVMFTFDRDNDDLEPEEYKELLYATRRVKKVVRRVKKRLGY